MTREEVLEEAKKCVCGRREQDYGSPENNFQLIADFWNDYLGLCNAKMILNEARSNLSNAYQIPYDEVELPEIRPLTVVDVSMMMALLKIARIKNGGGTGDSFVDLAGYAACGGELNECG